MSVIASSLFFSSCGDDDDDDEPKKETPNNTPTNNNDSKDDKKPVGASVNSFVAAAGDYYELSNSTIGVYGVPMKIVAVEGSTVTISISGYTVTIGSASADKSYCIYVDEDGTIKEASMGEAKEAPESILFICQTGSKISSGTLASSEAINSKAGSTTFQKME